MARTVVNRNPALVLPPKDDPRPGRDPAYIRRLADDILARGLRHPPVIVTRDGGDEIVVGEHRRLALVLLRVPEAEFFQLDGEMTETDLAVERLLEAEMHTPLSPLQKGAIYQQLARDGLTHGQIAARLHTSEGEISKALRIRGHLAPDLQADVENGRLPVSSAYLLVGLPDHDEQRRLAAQVTAGHLTRDALAARVKALRGGGKSAKPKPVKVRTTAGAVIPLPADHTRALAELAALTEAVKKAQRLNLPMESVSHFLRG